MKSGICPFMRWTGIVWQILLRSATGETPPSLSLYILWGRNFISVRESCAKGRNRQFLAEHYSRDDNSCLPHSSTAHGSSKSNDKDEKKRKQEANSRKINLGLGYPNPFCLLFSGLLWSLQCSQPFRGVVSPGWPDSCAIFPEVRTLTHWQAVRW